MQFHDLSNPFERDNELCSHGVERCLPCPRCEKEAELEVEEEVEEVLEIATPELSTVSG